MNKNNRKFEALDSLRGVAAIAIAIFHFYPNWAWGGYLAVDFFLVLSGFVLSHSYLYKETAVKPVEFISHRVSRLYPLHLFTLIVFILAYVYTYKALPQYKDGTIFVFIQQLTLTQNIGLNPSGITYNYPSWSISVEFWVNILFILLISKDTKSSSLFIIAVVCLLVIYGNTGKLDTYSKNYFTFINSGMIRGISSFFLGIISYRMYLYFRDDDRIRRRSIYLEILCIAGVLFVVFARQQKYSGLDFFAPFLFMIVVAVFSLESSFFSRHIRIYKYLGEISYSIYLNQIPVLLLIGPILSKYALPVIGAFFAYLAILMTVSHFTYRYIEKPFRKKGRSVLVRLTRP